MPKPSLAMLRKLQEQAQALLQERDLPLPDDGDSSRGRRALLFWARVYHSFVRNRCPVRAAALAYTNLLALVPLLAVGVSVSTGLLKSQGEQSIQDWIREAVTRVAPMVGLQRANELPVFQPDDIPNNRLAGIVDRMAERPGPVSHYLWTNRFTEESKRILTNETETVELRKQALVAELNNVVDGPYIYEADRFSKVDFSPRTVRLLARTPAGATPTGAQLRQLNHSLLADTYRIAQDPLDTVTSQIYSFVNNFQSGKLGVTAVLALIFVAISLLATIETTFNDIWGVSRGRGWFARVVQYWAALTLGPMFMFSALTVTTWAKVSQQVIDQVPLVRFFMPFLLPLVILSFGCALLYLVMPNTRVPWQAALLGGFTAGALLQLNSYFNVLYVSRVLTYKQIYGSMAALPLFLIGLYLSWLLVLLGAQVAYAFQNRHAYVQERKAENINQRGREFLALRLMVCIAQRFCDGDRPPTSTQLAEYLRTPLRLVTQIMTLLSQAGLALEIAGSETGYAPGRPLSQITASDILQALRVGQGQDLAPGDDPACPVVQKEFANIEAAFEHAASSRSLEDLIQGLTRSPRKPRAAVPA